MRKLLPSVTASILAVIIGYLGWNTCLLQVEIDSFAQKFNRVSDIEKRLTLEKERLTLINNLNTSRAQIIGGALVLISAYIGWRNLKISEDKQATDRFTKAVEQLGHSDISIRLGGIYGLERIAHTSDEEYWQVMEILTAYLREKAPWPPRNTKDGKEVEQGQKEVDIRPWTVNVESFIVETLPEQGQKEVEIPPKADIQAVLTVLSRRKHSFLDGEEHPLDLRKTDLRWADLRSIKLQGALLFGSHLEGAHLEEAILSGVNLEGTHLEGTHLEGAHLEGAILSGVNLEGTHLEGAHLEGAILSRAHLKGTYLKGTNLKGAVLWGADLRGSVLWGADLEDADLRRANLGKTSLLKDGDVVLEDGAIAELKLIDAYVEGVDLKGVNLKGADLEGANLEGARLQGANLEEAKGLKLPQLEKAVVDESTILPAYLNSQAT